ncbi:DUF308 domain-containing protein [Arthrobacter sp. NA-172]|uniref:DUF308 domain-containing protein n=1 Tax=Arthrobacter sp. NA-172 TaxID=3367524 RepID=UPI003754F764
MLTGIVTTVFGFFVLVNPGAGFLSVVGLLATYAAVSGVLLIASGIKLRRRATSSVMTAH